MVTLAATDVSPHPLFGVRHVLSLLQVSQSSQIMANFAQKAFKADEYIPTCIALYNYITDRLENDPLAADALNRFRSWAGGRCVVMAHLTVVPPLNNTNSDLVKELLNEIGVDE